MKPKYKIGEFAKNLGVSVGFLKHHEQHGLLSPSISPSGYRYYSFAHAMQTLQCLRLQNIGFTAKEIADIMNNSSEIDISAAMLAKKEMLLKQIAFDQEVLQYLDEHFPDHFPLTDVDAFTNWSIGVPGGFLYLENASEGDFLSYTPEMEEAIKDWNQYAPLTSVCTHISIDPQIIVHDSDETDPWIQEGILSWKMGLSLDHAQAQRLGAYTGEPARLITPGKSLIWHFAGLRQRRQGRSHISDMLDGPLKICREHNLPITGEIYSVNAFASTAKPGNYVQETVILPLK